MTASTHPVSDQAVPVTQADRDAARQFILDEWPSWDADHQTVSATLTVAFARHRTSAPRPVAGEVELLRATLIKMGGMLPGGILDDRVSSEFLTNLPVELAAALQGAADQGGVNLAVEAVRGVSDDYQTSEHHHPGHVLIPLAKFEQLQAAEAALCVAADVSAPDGYVERLARIIYKWTPRIRDYDNAKPGDIAEARRRAYDLAAALTGGQRS